MKRLLPEVQCGFLFLQSFFHSHRIQHRLCAVAFFVARIACNLSAPLRYIQTLVVRNLSTYVKRIRFQVPKSQEFRIVTENLVFTKWVLQPPQQDWRKKLFNPPKTIKAAKALGS